jgi:asparagine synthase (glutamine-hydrolysing)
VARVPFCDHVHKVLWAMKTFDGREKSLLRAAVADLLPESVVQRVKRHYPQTNDAAYTEALRDQCLLLDDPRHGVFDLVDRRRLDGAAAAGRGEAMPFDLRLGVELVLDPACWIDEYRPGIKC